MTTHDEVQELVKALPSYYEDAEDGGNWKLLHPAGQEIVDLDGDIEELDRESTVQEALDVNSLEELAAFVELGRQTGETADHYKARIISEYQLNTSEGTIEGTVNSLKEILGCSVDDIWFQDWRILYGDIHNKTICFLVSPEYIDGVDLSGDEISETIKKLSPAGSTIKTQYRGDLLYKSKEQDQSNSWDGYEDGYDHLDSDGNPSGSGGTKGGLI
jgi:hypothetical protein